MKIQGALPPPSNSLKIIKSWYEKVSWFRHYRDTSNPPEIWAKFVSYWEKINQMIGRDIKNR